MSKVMGAFAAVGAILVPVAWLGGFEVWAIVAMLFVTTMLVQGASIDLPGVPDSPQLHRLWSKKWPPHDRTTNRCPKGLMAVFVPSPSVSDRRGRLARDIITLSVAATPTENKSSANFTLVSAPSEAATAS